MMVKLKSSMARISSTLIESLVQIVWWGPGLISTTLSNATEVAQYASPLLQSTPASNEQWRPRR